MTTFFLLLELVRKDWIIFIADKRSMVLTFLVPIAIACFLGSLLGLAVPGSSGSKVDVIVVNQDNSATAKEILSALGRSSTLKIRVADLATAKESIKAGKTSAAIIIGPGFGAAGVSALSGGPKPPLEMLVDPSKNIETQIVKGVAIQLITGALAKEAFGTDDSEKAIPFQIQTQGEGSAGTAAWSGSAHAFAGMGVQALFFGAMEFGMAMMRDRESGIWSRMRAAPASPWLLLGGRLIGSTILSFITYLVVFASGEIIFGFRIHGSYIGFTLVALALAVFVAATGIFIAALGQTEQQSRRLSIFVILAMLMLGGAWVPIFLLPSWMQVVSLFTPVRWAVDGIDAMTWKGEGLIQALPSVGVLIFFGLALAVYAGTRFKWESSSS